MRHTWRHGVLFSLILCLSAFFWGCSPGDTTALIPLDSRPCNTDECVLLAEARDTTLLLPGEGLDDFTTPGNPEHLWTWLDEKGTSADKLIIFSNSLLNGGLIASRNLDSYSHSDHFLDRLESWLNENPDVHVTLVTVLPRSLPSQYDPLIAPYSESIQNWGASLDRALRENAPLPAPPEDIPPEASRRYMALFEANLELCRGLLALEKAGLCDTYYIAYDDNSPYCASRAVVHLLAPDMPRPALNGADEITALLLARAEENLPVQIHYTDPASAAEVPPFEGQSLEDTVLEKCAFLNFSVAPDAPRHLVVHNSPGAVDRLSDLLAALPPEEPLALADVALTNRGDPTLWPLFSRPTDQLIAYSGWNTAANSLGTSLSALRISADHPNNLQALRGYLKMRLAIDQGYLAHLGPMLREEWLKQGLITPDGSFSGASARTQCTRELNHAFHAWAQDSVLSDTPPLYFPWLRTFEVGQGQQ